MSPSRKKAKKPIVKLHWLRLTEEGNALDFLKRAHHFIQQVEQDDAAWKWVIISLYGALYGFLICGCKGTNPDNVTVTTKKGVKKLITFNEALKRCQDPSRRQMSLCHQHLVITSRQQESVRRLQDDFRHKFEHYIPTGWSIEIHGMPYVCLEVLEVIRALIFSTGILLHLNTRERRKLKSYIVQSRRMLRRGRLYLELRSIESEKSVVYSRPSRSKLARLLREWERNKRQAGLPESSL